VTCWEGQGYAIFADLADRFGVAKDFTEGRTAMEWLRHLYDQWRDSLGARWPVPGRGVGTWTYIDAGHAGSGYAGSAQVLIRSSIKGETITAIYDVFAAASQATARFRLAEANFRQYRTAGGFRLVHLRPAVSAFCGLQAGPADTTTCRFNYKVTNGNVTTTAPPAYSGDGPAVLRAMLSHLLALTG
jgi:hypothetical protein